MSRRLLAVVAISMLALPAAAQMPVASAQPEVATLVLVTGQALPVRRYEVVGRVVRITDDAGKPLVMRADLIDLDRSAQASAARQRDVVAAQAAEREKAAAAAAEQLRRRESQARHLAQSGGGGGNMWLPETTETSEPDATDATEPDATEPSAVKPGSDDRKLPESQWQRSDRERAAHKAELTRQYKELGVKYNDLVRQSEAPNAARAHLLAEAKAVDDERKAIKQELAQLEP